MNFCSLCVTNVGVCRANIPKESEKISFWIMYENFPVGWWICPCRCPCDLGRAWRRSPTSCSRWFARKSTLWIGCKRETKNLVCWAHQGSFILAVPFICSILMTNCSQNNKKKPIGFLPGISGECRTGIPYCQRSPLHNHPLKIKHNNVTLTVF